MSNPATHESKVELTQEQLLELLAEIKKPYVDPKEELRKETEKREMREEWERNEALREEREANCSHLREDNTSAIAWLTNSDHVTRGVCQRCFGKIYPTHPRYIELTRIPTRGQSVYYV